MEPNKIRLRNKIKGEEEVEVEKVEGKVVRGHI